MCVPNLSDIGSRDPIRIRSKVIRGSQNFEIGSCDHKPRPF